MRARTNHEAPSATPEAILEALAAGPYVSTVRLADELGIDPAQTRAIVDALDEAGHIRRDDGLAWALTATGRLELRTPRRRASAWRLLRAPRHRPGTGST